MRILALDYSTHAGYAVFDGDSLVAHGTLHLGATLKEHGEYPWNYLGAAYGQAAQVLALLVRKYQPEVVVIEETNGSKNRYTQKLLEFLHCALLIRLFDHHAIEQGRGLPPPVVYYVNTGDWRKNLGIGLTKDQKKANTKLSKAKSVAKAAGTKLDKKKLGIKGRITKKHAAVAYVNDRFGFKLKIKDNDAAEAICIGLAYLNNVPHCNGE